MGKRSFGQSPKADLVRLEQGRGLGAGADYRPWIQTHEFPSRGQVNRVFGFVTKRVHHLLSQLELHVFYLAEWLPNVRDIREQYPLPLGETQAIANSIGVAHPLHPKSREPITMTSDFRITIATDSGLVDVVRAVKPSAELDKHSKLMKLDIERLYWKSQGIEWGIITEREIPRTFIRNAEFVRGYEDSESLPVGPSDVTAVDSFLRGLLKNQPSIPLGDLSRRGDRVFGYEPGTSLAVIRHLIAARIWHMDMHQPIAAELPLPVAKFAEWLVVGEMNYGESSGQ